MRRCFLFLLALSSLMQAGTLVADDDGPRRYREPDVKAVNNPIYRNECGSCHFAYQPGFLPARSWQRLMEGLADHFGDNAELAARERAVIEHYLVVNSADNAAERRSRKFMRSIGDTAPLRITEVPYFRREHREIPQGVIRLEQVGSLGNCAACHSHADLGSYAEREIRIPGIGRWKDD